MNNYTIDDEIALAEQLRDAWKRDPIYYYTPLPGGQKKVWDCTKQNQIACGGNRAGKTRVFLTKEMALVVPHPQDNNYSYWPTNLEDRRKGLKIDLRNGVEVWISKRSYTDHEEVTMKYLWEGFKGATDIPPLLRGRVLNATFCPNNSKVWHTVEINNGHKKPSLVTLKSEEAGKRSYEGASKNAVFFDEPCNPDVYKEGKMRVIDTHGYTFYGLTGAMATDADATAWRNITYVKNELLTLGPTRDGNTDFQEVIYLPTIENPFIDYDFQVGQTEGMSVDERNVRLTGHINIATGQCAFNLDDLGYLRGFVKAPQFIGVLEENFKGDITDARNASPNWAVYLVDNEYAPFAIRVYHYPERGRQYFIGVDVGGGKDFTSVVVIDDEWRICAVQHGRVDEISLAIELSKLGRFYYDAWVAIETNKEGKVTTSWMWKGNSDLGLKKYSKLYRRTKSTYELRGNIYIPGSDLGWFTSGGSRDTLITNVRELLIRSKRNAWEDFFLIQTNLLLDECTTFCLSNTGKYEALEGSFDDTVIATGIAIQCLKTYLKRILSRPDRQPTQPAYYLTDKGQLVVSVDTIIQQHASSN